MNKSIDQPFAVTGPKALMDLWIDYPGDRPLLLWEKVTDHGHFPLSVEFSWIGGMIE